MGIKRIGVLTGGGDCPGLNAAIRAVVRRGIGHHGYHVWGIAQGWLGLLTAEMKELDLEAISGILPRGGTILGTSRTSPFATEDGPRKVLDTIKLFDLDALIVIGGNGTLAVAHQMAAQGVRLVGIPKTIDNDLSGTDYTFGFDTAVTVATDAIDRLHTTAESHHRVMVVEVMGRNAGWIATVAGIAGGGDIILIPEVPFDFAEVSELVKKRQAHGKPFSIVVVAEGAVPKDSPQQATQDRKVDAFGHVRLGGIGTVVGEEIEKRTGIETRVTILGHIQRGGSPTAFDRVLATRFGVAAVDLVAEGKFGRMVAVQGNRITSVPLAEAVASPKVVDKELYELAKVFFG